MNYPWPLSTRTEVEIDPDDVLEYVRSNREWFVEKLQNLSPEREVLEDLVKKIGLILDENDFIRRNRDSSHSFDNEASTKLYNALSELKSYIESQI